MSASELRHIIWEQSWVDIFALPQVLLRRDTYAILGTPSLRVLWDIALGALIFSFKVIFCNASGPFGRVSIIPYGCLPALLGVSSHLPLKVLSPFLGPWEG